MVRAPRHREALRGRTPADGIELAERVSGDTSVGHALAFCRAVEDAYRSDVGRARPGCRAVLLELERLYNHVTDIGALCNDVGHGILNDHAQRIREQLLRINDQVTGHRLLRGAVVIGGARAPRPARPRPVAPPSPPTSPRSSTSPCGTAWSATGSPAPRC